MLRERMLELMGLEPEATPDAIKRRYRELALRYHPDVNPGDDRAHARLSSFQEVPSLSTPGSGSFEAKLGKESFSYEVSYRNLSSPVLQAHIHFGQKGVNGGISVFLCQTATNPDPTGQAPMCPPPPAVVTGTLDADNIIGPAGQGVAAGQMAELIAAIKSQVAYVNVHSSTFLGGEIRGQFDRGRRGHDHDDDD